MLGYRVYELSQSGVWFVLYFLGWLIWYIILSIYYFSKKYRIPFYVILLLIAANLFAAFLLTNQTNEITLSQFYTSLIINTFITVHGIALIISVRHERGLLNVIGIFYACFGLLMVGITLWIFNSLTAGLDGYGMKATLWSPFFENFALILFIIHFVKERKQTENVNIQPQRWVGHFNTGLLFIVIIVLIVMGFKTWKNVAEIKSHAEPASDYEQKLAQRFEVGLFTSENKKLPYRFLKPLDYDSTKEYPLVVCLHGSSGRGVGNIIQVSRSLMATKLSAPENREKYPIFLFVPQCAPNAEWGGPGHLPEYNPLVIKAVDSLEKVLPIDKTRVYLTGYSMGGYGAWDLIGTHPTLFAAAVPMCGAGDPNLAQNMVDVPIWAFHGARDRNVLVRGSRDVINALREAGGNPLYTEYKDKRHSIWENISKEPGLLPWLFSQGKN